MMPIYLDNNATTQPAPMVVERMTQAMSSCWANPSSVHRAGQHARQQVELARASVAQLIGARARDVIFTSGGTESNNLALRGALRGGRGVLITTHVEHSAVRELAEALAKDGVTVAYLPVDRQGRVAPQALTAALREYVTGEATAVVSVQWANNETGVIQPVAVLAQAVAAYRAEVKARVLLHIDATQAVGKIPVDVSSVPVDLLTLAAHKFHGPKGVGALYIRRGVRLAPQLIGGPQERETRGGTENTFGIIGMGAAADLAMSFVVDERQVNALRALRDEFERGVVEAMPDTVINGHGGSSGDDGVVERLWNTSNLGFPRLEAEAILVALSEQGVYASAGAACSSGSLEPSPVLLAMGIEPETAHGSVRFSMSRHTTADEMKEALRLVCRVVGKVRQAMPAGAGTGRAP